MRDDLHYTSCDVTVRGSHEEPVVRIAGEVDVATTPLVRDALSQCVDAGARRIVVDCSSLEFIGAAGISVLVEAANALDDAGELVLRSPSPFVVRLLEITRVDVRIGVEGPPPAPGATPT